MKNLTTLTEFINLQIEKFELDNTDKVRNKLRRKCVRELKELRIWEEAEIRLIGRNKTKVFTENQLHTLYLNIESYLLKRSKIDLKSLDSYRRDVIDNFEAEQEFWSTGQYPEKKKEEPGDQIPEWLKVRPVGEKEINEFMLKALFLKFYEPINEDLWNKDRQDKELISSADNPELSFEIDSYKINERLKNPIKYYTKLRQDNEE